MATVLETEYIVPVRPYSQNELAQMRENLYNNLRLGKVIAIHSQCKHFYLVKKNGRKEKEILEQKYNDAGNCSVCWKIGKTRVGLRSNALNLVQHYQEIFYKEPKYLSYNLIDLESIFYRWLYEDQTKG
jgi:hypothetical protein